MKAIFVYVTCPSLQIAQSIGRALLESHIIACVNIFPITSIYRWEGKIVDENEVVMVLKTTELFGETVIAEIKRLHPYQISCIAKIPVEVDTQFGRWLESEINQI